MPGLIVHQGTTDGEPRQQKSPREKILERASPNNQRATRWVWICTAVITLAVAGVWGYGFAAQLSFLNLSNSSEAKLIKNTKEQWNFFFTQQPTTTAGVKEEITAALNHIIASSTPTVINNNTTTGTTTNNVPTIETVSTTTF